MTSEFASRNALARCMHFVGMPEDEFIFGCEAYLRILEGRAGAGNIGVTFQRSIGRSGALHTDRATMEGFGIRFTEFNPEYQTFTYREVDDRAELTIASVGPSVYAFVLTFRKG